MCTSFVIVDAVVIIKIRIALLRQYFFNDEDSVDFRNRSYIQSSRVRLRIIFYGDILYKTMYTSFKKRTSFFVKTKVQSKH